MDAVKFLEERKRMFKNGKSVPDLGVNITYNSEKVVKFVEEWSAAHPCKTRQSVFLERFPDAKIDNNGVLDIKPCSIEKSLADSLSCRRSISCDKCFRDFWGQEVE